MKTIKAIILLILIPVLTIGQLHTISLNNRDTSKAPCKYDYRKCLFTIKIGDWTTNRGRKVLPVTTTLNNTADDTLKYETMTYRMLAYELKGNNFEYEYPIQDILKNFLEIVKIPPHQSTTLSFNVCKIDTTNNLKIPSTLQIGFCLVLIKEDNEGFLFEDPFAYKIDEHGNLMPHSKELMERTHWLWSNSIKL